MAGRSAAEAFDNFVRPIQRALSCVTNEVLVRSHDAAKAGGPRSVVLPRKGDFVRLQGQNRLRMWVAVEYEIVQTSDPGRGPWKVSTRKYWYHIVTDDLTEVVLYHWHPDDHSPEQGPHLHLGSSQLTQLAVVSHKTHMPTGRIALESVIQLLIADLGVVPRRTDHETLLVEGKRLFEAWRTWP